MLFFIGLFFDMKKPVSKISKFALFFVNNINYLLCILGRVKINVKNKECMPNDDVLIVTNHISNFDPMVVMKTYHRKKIFCVTKYGNLKIPVCGPYIYKAGFIPIDRENPKEGLKAIKKAVSYLDNKVGSIYICPEGTRSKDGLLHEFHPGSFKIALWSKKPIVLISVKNTDMIHKNFPLKRTKVDLNVLKVIQYDEYKDMTAVDLSLMAYNLIKEDLERN